MKNNCKSRLIFGSVNLDFGSEYNFIHVSDHKIYERIATTFLVAFVLILNLVLNYEWLAFSHSFFA